MKAYNKILKKLRQINIEAFEYVFINGVGWEKNIDFENLPKILEKRFFWELENLNEKKLRKLQSDAVNELSLLKDEQLKKCLRRLDLINEFQIFFDFIKSFYVKFEDKKHTDLDIFDFKNKLKDFFSTSLPDRGEFEIYFLEELQEQLFFKSSILDGLKWQIEYLLEYEVEPLTPQQKKDLDCYIKSFKQNYFRNTIEKFDTNKRPNPLFYGKVTAHLLEQKNNGLGSNNLLKDRFNLLSEFNKHVYFLVIHTIDLYKTVNQYLNSKDNGVFTKIKINEDNVINSLSNIKEYATVIKHNIIDDEVELAIKIKNYCLLMFDDWVGLLNKSFGIDIYLNPLKIHFENVKLALENSINLDELKILNDLDRTKSEKTTQTLNNSTLAIHQSKTIKQFYQPIVFTLKEYESIYESRLSEHLKIHIDYDANHFILDEKNNYEFYLNLIDSIGCVPDDMMNLKNKFPIINIDNFNYNNLYFKEGAVDTFFIEIKENNEGYVIIEEARPDVINIINLFKNLTFDEFIFKSYNLKNSFRLIHKFLKEKKKENNLKDVKESLNSTDNRIKQIVSQNEQFLHPPFNPNLWNSDCFELFKYLFDCYYKDTNRQLTNIWFYLKECGINKYNIKATKDKYKGFILENYKIKISNFDKAQIKWEDKERETINEHRINFEDSLK